jgi:hypothetical protein
MDHPNFLANRAADLNEFRKARMGIRARSFTFGEASSVSRSMGQSSAAPPTAFKGTTGTKASLHGPSKSVTTATAIVEEGEHEGHSGDSSFDSPAVDDSPCPPSRPAMKPKGGSWGRYGLERAATSLDLR